MEDFQPLNSGGKMINVEDCLTGMQAARTATKRSRWINMFIFVIFFAFFTGLAVISHRYQNFSIEHGMIDNAVMDLKTSLNNSLMPLQDQLQSKGPLGVLADRLQAQKDQLNTTATTDPQSGLSIGDPRSAILLLLLSGSLNPDDLRKSDNETMKNLSEKVGGAVKSAENVVTNITAEAYKYLDLGQTVLRKIMYFIFIGSVGGAVLSGLVLLLGVLPSTHLLRATSQKRLDHFM